MEVTVTGCPSGLGEPVFDKLDADIAKALMSIGAVKAVEIGIGLEASRLLGSQCNDEIMPDGFVTNRCGGILAGISNGWQFGWHALLEYQYFCHIVSNPSQESR